jgi:radical SAM superfamily enzyme YgiQ (UPF0313 family)
VFLRAKKAWAEHYYGMDLVNPTPPDVLYIHPAKQPVGFRYDLARGNYIPYLLMPVGVIGLANLLQEHGLAICGLNYAIEAFLDPLFDLRTWLRARDSARLVMVDLHWYEHAYGALDVARVCRQVLPQAQVVIGGFTASLFAREIMADFPEVDFIIRGDAELPLLALAEQVCHREGSGIDLSAIPNLTYRQGAAVAENAQTYIARSEDLDALNFVATDFLDHHLEYAQLQYMGVQPPVETPDISQLLRLTGHWLSVGRGCLFDCAYCGGGKRAHRVIAGRQTITLRSVSRILTDIEQLANLGYSQVSLTLDPAILGEVFWSALFGGLRERGIRIGIYNEHFQLPSEAFISDFATTADLAHSVIAVSPLSGSSRVRRTNGKCFSDEQLVKTLNVLKRYDVPLMVYFSLNLPGEDRDGFGRTLALAEKIIRIYPEHLLRIYNMCHTIDPCAPMSAEPRRFGVELDLRTFRDYYRYCQQTYISRPEMTRGALRGFAVKGRPVDAIEAMAVAWDRLCSRREAVCRPVLSV